MSREEGLIYGLEFQCRCLAAVEWEPDAVQFLVGTQGLKLDNQIHLLELDEENISQIVKKASFIHNEGEIWQLASHPDQGTGLFCTRYSSIGGDGTQKMKSAVWNRPETDNGLLSPVCRVEDVLSDPSTSTSSGTGREMSHVSWMPTSPNQLMVLQENQILLHDVEGGGGGASRIVANGKLEGKGSGHAIFSGGSWNPHQNCKQFATTNDHHVRGWDVRSMKQAWHVQECFSTIIRSIDFNPNKQYQLATAGDDGAVRFWDIRQASQGPVAARTTDHSHWVWSVRYNAFHDQLILTSSSDGHVVLSSMTSISSEPFGHLEDDLNEEGDSNKKGEMALQDGVIKTYDDHEDSVYAAEWSCADPWTFASLSYDGRLVINQVPRSVKFRILNLV